MSSTEKVLLQVSCSTEPVMFLTVLWVVEHPCPAAPFWLHDGRWSWGPGRKINQERWVTGGSCIWSCLLSLKKGAVSPLLLPVPAVVKHLQDKDAQLPWQSEGAERGPCLPLSCCHKLFCQVQEHPLICSVLTPACWSSLCPSFNRSSDDYTSLCLCSTHVIRVWALPAQKMDKTSPLLENSII